MHWIPIIVNCLLLLKLSFSQPIRSSEYDPVVHFFTFFLPALGRAGNISDDGSEGGPHEVRYTDQEYEDDTSDGEDGGHGGPLAHVPFLPGTGMSFVENLQRKVYNKEKCLLESWKSILRSNRDHETSPND